MMSLGPPRTGAACPQSPRRQAPSRLLPGVRCGAPGPPVGVGPKVSASELKWDPACVTVSGKQKRPVPGNCFEACVIVIKGEDLEPWFYGKV